MIVPSPLETSTAKVLRYWLIDVNQRQPRLLNFDNLRAQPRRICAFVGINRRKATNAKFNRQGRQERKKTDPISKYILY